MPYGTIKVDTVTFTNDGVDKSVSISGLVQNPTFSGNVTVTGTISGVTVTGTTASFTSGNFTNISGGTHAITSGVFASGSATNPSISFTSDPNTGIYSPGADQVAISTNGTGRLFVSSNGSVGIGTDNPQTTFHIGSSVNNLFMDRNETVTGGPNAVFRKSRGSASAPSVVSTGDFLGALQYTGYDGTTYQQSAIIRGEVDGTVSSGAVPGRIVFLTQLGGATSERLRITSDGKVGLGTSSPQNFFHLRSDANSAVTHLYLMNRTSGASVESRIAFTTSANDLSDNRHAYIGAVTTGAGQNGNSFVIATNPNGGSAQTRVFVSSTGNVGVGTTSPGAVLHSAVSSGAVVFRGSHNNTGLDLYANDASGEARITASRLGGSGGKFLSFYTDTGTGEFERARIDSSGKLLVGTSSAIAATTLTPGFQHQGTDSSFANAGFGRWTNDTGGYALYFAKSRGTSVGSQAIVSDGDFLGALFFEGSDGTQLRRGASITANVDGTPGTNDMPGRLVFSTTADGASSPTERMRISNAGTTTLTSAASTAPFIANIGASERARIDSSGRLLVGTGTAISTAALGAAQVQVVGTDNTTSQLAISRFSNDADRGRLTFIKSRGSSGTNTIVQADDAVGRIEFLAADGSGSTAYPVAAHIGVFVDGTPGTNDMPGRIVLSTTADGASSPTERLRITNDGVQAYNQPAPTSKSAAATLTVAELKTGIIQYTGAAATLTLPTGTLTEGGFSGIYTNMTFEWSVINTGSGTCTIGAGTDHTIVGGATIAAGASGRFASRRTAANTFVSYRLS